MRKKVVTIEPEATVEHALHVAQSRNVGSLVVVRDAKVVGILTTNDFFYRIVNKTLGLGESSTRIIVSGGGKGKSIEKIMAAINKLGIKIKTLWTVPPPGAKKNDLILHLNTEDATPLIEALEAQGFSASVRPR